MFYIQNQKPEEINFIITILPAVKHFFFIAKS
jgi:hypothetical protein